MPKTVFKDTTYSLANLVEEIDRGEIALPELQRPFVWKATKVRDLFDSMYKGFPVGFLLLWATGAEVGAKPIGVDAKQSAPRLMIVDGQQRLTSLYAVLKGRPVLNSDFKQIWIKLAFRPTDGSFEVTDAAIQSDPEWIPDISKLWVEGVFSTCQAYLKRLESSKGPVDVAMQERIWKAIDRLHDLQNYQFKVIELSSSVEEEEVAEIFVRINSEGVRLVQSDFILTLMSVWWDKGRKELEEFARAAKLPPAKGPSPANPFIDPSPDQLLRVSTGLAFHRGALRHVYRILRGRHPETGEVDPKLREEQFAKLQQAQKVVLDLTNWHEFLKCLRMAGFRSRSMITSENNILFAYLMYLIGRYEHDLNHRELRGVIASWFFMTALTGRYTGSFESRVEQDLRRVGEAKDGSEFMAILRSIIETELTPDFWEIRLPTMLESSAAYSPALFAYYAALILLDATPLFSDQRIGLLLDPSSHAPKSAIERHHLFPKAYLAKLGYGKVQEINQIANYAFVEWPDNVEIGDQSPAEYFPGLWSRLDPERQKKARFWHALPEGWETMPYKEFLAARRKLMAEVIRAGFDRLTQGETSEDADQERTVYRVKADWSLEELIAGEESGVVEFKSSAYYSYRPDVPPRVVTDSVIKTIAGFLNADGGILVVGVADDGEVLGIEPDLAAKGVDEDRYVNWLTSVVSSSLDPSAAAAQVAISIRRFEDVPVAVIEVRRGVEPVFAKVSKSDKAFFVRMNNSTRELSGPDLVSYLKLRFGV
ncbi:MAG: hypothetical protein KatS3mg011_1635 [Acidimicrobiia bacterium]|nr:MAG: hypothetical protein KatS3mg011_1635 [Acidimicrobiia bacterium]